MKHNDAITLALQACADGDRGAWDQVVPYIYAELRKLADGHMRRERSGHTLQPTALVHESYLRLVSQRLPRFESRRHFYGVAAQIMRQVLVDSARAHRASKRGAGGCGAKGVDPDSVSPGGSLNWDILELHDALTRLAETDTEQARAIELHYFGGLAVADIAELTGTPERTLARRLRAGRLWLARTLSAEA